MTLFDVSKLKNKGQKFIIWITIIYLFEKFCLVGSCIEGFIFESIKKILSLSISISMTILSDIHLWNTSVCLD
jgi:hypothetical protein